MDSTPTDLSSTHQENAPRWDVPCPLLRMLRTSSSSVLLPQAQCGSQGHRGQWRGSQGGEGGGDNREVFLPCQHLRMQGPTPVRIKVLRIFLCFYPDKEAMLYFDQGFSLGFHIPSLAPSTSTWAQNLRSVGGMEDMVQKKIGKEMAAGWILGPFPPFPNLWISPLGVVPKKIPGEFRWTQHLSFL